MAQISQKGKRSFTAIRLRGLRRDENTRDTRKGKKGIRRKKAQRPQKKEIWLSDRHGSEKTIVKIGRMMCEDSGKMRFPAVIHLL
jgi:hypothetical protein